MAPGEAGAVASGRAGAGTIVGLGIGVRRSAVRVRVGNAVAGLVEGRAVVVGRGVMEGVAAGALAVMER